MGFATLGLSRARFSLCYVVWGWWVRRWTCCLWRLFGGLSDSGYFTEYCGAWSGRWVYVGRRFSGVRLVRTCEVVSGCLRPHVRPLNFSGTGSRSRTTIRCGDRGNLFEFGCRGRDGVLLLRYTCRSGNRSARCRAVSGSLFALTSTSRESYHSTTGRFTCRLRPLFGAGGGGSLSGVGVPGTISHSGTGGNMVDCSISSLTGHFNALCPRCGSTVGRGVSSCNRFLPRAFFRRINARGILSIVGGNARRREGGLFGVLNSICRSNAGRIRSIVNMAVLNRVGGSPSVVTITSGCVARCVTNPIRRVGGVVTGDGELAGGLTGPPTCGPGGGGGTNVLRGTLGRRQWATHI